MIKIVLDNKTITANTAADLTPAQLAEMFPSDARDDVMLTYVITTQPTSRRTAPIPG